MKKAKIIGKKTLSVFLAVLMVLTAWVWVAPQKAEAATMGNYDVTVKINLEDDDAVGGHIQVWYYPLKSDNSGFDTTQTNKEYTLVNSLKGVSGDKTYSDTIPGFPWRFEFKIDDTDLFDETYLRIDYIKIGTKEIVSSSIGDFQNAICYFDYNGTFTPHDENGNGIGVNAGRVDSLTGEGFTWDLPKPTGTYDIGAKAMTCPKSGTATQTVKINVDDQYGVPMYNPKWSVSGSKCGTTGISVTSTTVASESTVITLTNAANNTSTTDTQTGTIVADWGTGTLSDTFTITDSKYDIIFSYDTVKNITNGAGSFPFRDADNPTTTEDQKQFHGDAVTNIPSPQPYYDSSSYYYTFKGWSSDGGTTILASDKIPAATADKTYVAYYNNEYVPAAYTALDKAIADGKALQNDSEYTSKYTNASRVTLNTALLAVPENYKTVYGIVSQDVIDDYAEAINDAIAALTLNTYNVIFLDESNAILKFETGIQYEGSVVAPPDENGYYDSENHYIFKGWTIDKNTGVITDAYTSVKQDLFIYPTYTVEAHTFTTSTVPSTCLQKGATKYTCSCGYSYIDGETEFGEHQWATEYTIDIQPNCTVAGQKSIYCTVEGCNAQKDITVIPALGHQWGTVSSLAPATCDRDGINTKLCDACGVCEHTTVPAIGHNYTKTIVAPTCTSKGYDEYICQNGCGHSYRDNYTDVIEHVYTKEEVIQEKACNVTEIIKYTCNCGYVKVESGETGSHDALDILEWDVLLEDTCTTKGYRTKTCLKCNDVIASEVFDEITTHDIKTETTNATCTTAGYIVKTCQRPDCGYEKTTVIQPLGHNWNAGETTAATCTSGEYITYTCERENCDETRVEIIDGSNALLHDFNENIEKNVTIKTPVTCENNGEKTVKCSRCDVTTTVIIPRLGHSYGAWEVVKEATNNEDGQWKRVCVNNPEHVEYITIPKGGHVWDNGTQTLAPTCTTTGTMVYKCSKHANCGITIKVTVPVIQHSVATRENPSATCTTEGKVESYCSVCNEVFSSIPAPIKAHNPVAVSTTAPTCTTSGYTTYACACGTFSYNEYDASKPATGHTYVGEITTPAGCTTEGLKTFTCDCGKSYTETIPATGHNYVEGESTDATCAYPATKTYNCNNKDCDASYVAVVATKTENHTWGGWKTVNEATNTSNGYETNTCSTCGKVEGKIIPATGAHVFDEATGNKQDATCTADGWVEYKCSTHSDCGLTWKDVITAKGHTQKLEYTAPTCIAVGSSRVVCSECSTEILSYTIPATGIHDFSGEGVKSDATCTATGTMTYTCLTNGCTATKVETIPAKGHDLTTTVTYAKCGVAGKVEITCSRCDDPDVEKTIILAANGHIWKDTPESTVDATCETDGSETYKCQYCDKTNVVVLPKLGHNWSDWVKVDATTTTDGSWYHKCQNQNCGKEETLEIPKGHNLVVDTENSKAATCEAEGKTIYVCESHDDCGVTIEVTHEKLNHSISSTRTEATCSVNGQIVRECLLCEKVIATEILYAKAHEFKEGVPHEATCTEAGYVEYQCKNCTYSYKAFAATQAAKGHTLVMGDSTATCVEKGEQTVYCNVEGCGYTTTIEVPAIGHDYVKQGETVAATCTTPSTEIYECKNKNCNDSYVKFISGTVPHSWSKWTITQAATADKYGIKERTCSVCNTVEIGKVAPIGNHTFVEKIEKEATCTEKGEKSFTCSAHTNCTANYTEEIPAKGHTQTIDYKAPSCVANGYSRIVCSVESCKAEIMSAEILATGIHDFSGDGVKVDAKCTTPGSITYNCKTNGCDATKVETIPAKGHAFKTEVNDATCESTGTVVTTCENCTSYKETITLAAKNHNWNAGVENPKATCTSEGTITYTCTVDGCGKTKTETVEKLDHEWNEWTVTPSTNNAPGSVSRKCKNCTETETVVIPAGGHNLVVDTNNSTDATCTREGTLVYKCEKHTDCGITVSVTVPMIQHTLTTTKKDATCTNAGSVVTRCTKCNVDLITTIIPEKNHKIKVTTTLATCTSEGSVVEYCEECKTTLKTTTLAKLIHDYSGTETVVTKATCTTDGEKTVKCQTCTATTTVIIPHTGHTWNAWIITKPATNTADGEMTRTCSNGTCTETVVIPKGGHTWDNGTVTKDATCTETGTMVYKCNNADHGNCTASYEVAISIKEHTIAQKLTEATCKVEGKVEAYCSVCDKNCEKPFSKTIIPVKAHVYKAGTAVAPTCTTSGYTPYTCSCGDSYNKYDESKPATGHTLVEGTSTADCVKPGEMILTCNVIGCTYSTKVEVPALGHDYQLNGTSDATCKAAASETYKCSRCTDSYTISVGEKTTDHKWGAWTVKESATASSLGYQTSECTVCGQIKVETIPATGEHNFNTEIGRQAATCTEDGWVKYECSTHTGENACGETSEVKIPATGHTEKHDYKAATCTETGYSRMVCTAENNAVLAEVVIPKLGHDWNDGNVTNATCKTEGKIVRTCSRGCTDTDVTVIPVNPNAHQYETTVNEATCTSAGSVITKCKLCGKETTNKTLAQLQHTWDSGSETTSATCLGVGVKTYKCACGATKTEDIPALGHDWGAWTETKASTNNDKGVLTRKCSRGCTETAEIPAGGHKLEVTLKTDATCTAPGSVTYTCTTNHTGGVKCGITVTVNLDKLQHELVHTETPATCDTKGKVVTKCEKCNTVTYITEIPATGCAWDKGVIKEGDEATCTKEGTMTFTCIHDASHQYTKTIAKTQHNYKPGTPVAATCTSNGYTPYKCETCDSSYVILCEAAKGHSFTEKVLSTATCTAGGTLTLKCADCSETMKTPVPALGHEYKKIGSTSATCAKEATETYKCSRCTDSYTVSVGAKTDAHDWNEWETVVQPDYTALGYKTRTCKICDKLEVETIAATGDHNLQEVRRDDPTCTTDGKIYFECKTEGHSCGVKDEVVIPKLGHIEELRYTAPSCTEEGSTSIFCTRCNKTISEEKTLDKLDHVFEIESIKNATCKTAGEISFKCKCGATKSEEIAVDSTAHKLHTTVNLATCKAEGSVVVTCENDCGYYEETSVPALQHNWSDWVKIDATNDKEGSWTSTCSRCPEKKVLVIPAGGHELVEDVKQYVAPTCKAEGTKVYKCTKHTDCTVTVTVTLEKIQHTIETKIIDATCTKEGSIKSGCTKCDYKPFADITLGKLAHEYEEINKVDATCTTAGYTTLKCKNCTAQYDRFDAHPNGHTFDEEAEGKVTIVPAYCENDGLKTVQCKFCDAKVETVIPATGHKYEGENAVVITKPTCTTTGYTTYTCDICNVAYTTNFVDPVPHNWDAWKVTTPSTNTTDGVLTRECSNGCTETAPIPAGGHTFDTTKPVSTTQGTCQTVGQKTFACTANHNCGITITVNTEFGGHDWTEWTKVDPTITSDGYWTRKCNTEDCGMVDTLTIPRGHNLVESGYKEAKCNEPGYRTYSCNAHTDCGVEITVVLEKTQHTIKTANEASTCIKEGFVKTYCEECTEVFSNVTLDMLPHNYDLENGEYTAPKQNADGSWTPGYYTYTCKTKGCPATKVEGDTTSYTVRFFDANGNLIEALTQIVLPGQSATVPEEKPSKAPDENYHYSFSGWDRDLREISKDLDVYPTYSKEAHFGGEATCNKYAVCDVCKNAYGSYDESKHVMTSEIESATCTESGTITYYCSEGCGKATTTQELKPMGHNYGKWEVYQTGNCSAPTIKIRRCSNHGCKDYELQEIVNNHTWHVVSEIAPTCTSNGYSEYKYCISCGITVDSEVIPALGHRDNNKDGRCDYCTYVQEQVTCNCMCHSTGFMKFIYSIVRFFWRLTKSTPSCSCGSQHY